MTMNSIKRFWTYDFENEGMDDTTPHSLAATGFDNWAWLLLSNHLFYKYSLTNQSGFTTKLLPWTAQNAYHTQKK